MSDKEREAQVWLAFASAAIAGYTPDDELDTFDDLIEDICDVSTTVADNMVSEFNARYGARDRPPSKRARSSKGGGGRSRSGRSRRTKEEVEEEEREE